MLTFFKPLKALEFFAYVAWYVLETTTTTVIGYKKIPIFGEPLKLMVVWGWERRDAEMSENGSECKQAINTPHTHQST